jgi:hypothetical protein
MGHYDKSMPEGVTQPEKQFMKLRLVLCIKVAGWLISKDQRWTVYYGTRHCNTLLLSAAELRRLMIKPVTHTQKVQQFRCTGCSLARVFPAISAGMQTFSSAVNSGSNW